MITVKHKRGRHAPNWAAVLYCYGKLLFARRVRVTVLFGPESFYKVDEPTFFKVCGWKSKLADGALDKSVRESLLAYKLTPGKAGWSYNDFVDFYKYTRKGLEGNKVNARFIGFKVLQFETHFNYTIDRVGFWPAFPWAGGNEPDEAPNNDFQYKLKIERA